MSVTQPAPELSQASTVTGRAPSIDHSAISTAPVSDAGTMPMRCVSGTPRILRVRSIEYLRRDLPSFDRCERPSTSSLSLSGVQPGRLAHGPEEKYGRAGRTAGGVFVNVTLLAESTRRVGTAWPAAASKDGSPDVKPFGISR